MRLCTVLPPRGQACKDDDCLADEYGIIRESSATRVERQI